MNLNDQHLDDPECPLCKEKINAIYVHDNPNS